jgi:prophage tail gpP-like protein
MFRCKIIEHFLEVGVFHKYGITQQGFEPFGIDVKISQLFFQLDAQVPDVTVDVGKTGFTTQAARCNGFLD